MALKSLLFTCLLFFNTFFVIAQNNTKNENNDIFSGFRIGSGISTFHSQKKGELIDYKPNCYAGIYYEFGEYFFKYQIELSYQNTGAIKKYEDWHFDLNYCLLGIIAKKNLFKEIQTNILFGVYGGLLLKTNITSDNTQSVDYVNEGISEFDYGLVLGAEQRIYQFKNNSILVDVRLNYGLYDFYGNSPYYISSRDSKWDRNFSINIGLQFELN